jgi:hypothetical protein
MSSSTAEEFFYRNAGSSYTPGKETEEQGKRRGAKKLAKAEREAAKRGWTVEWEHDPEPWDGDDDDQPSEVLNAVLRDKNGKVLASLGAIGDPSRSYGRVVEAELALEALGSKGRRTGKRKRPAKRRR